MDVLIEKFKYGGKALDVGSGSGYLTACLARANRKATPSPTVTEKLVVGIEHQAPLVELAIHNINNDDPSLIKNGELIIVGEFDNDIWIKIESSFELCLLLL